MTKKRYFILLISLLLGTALFMAGCSGGTTSKTTATTNITATIKTTAIASKDSTAQNGDTVKVDYTLKLADGTVYDTSVGKTPFEFTLGKNKVIAGFEKAVIGMKVGDSKTVTILAAEAYGAYNDKLVQVVPRSQLPQGMTLQVGQKLQATNTDGTTSVVTIVKVDDTTVTVDGNSPLAGKDLTFDIKLLEIELITTPTTTKPATITTTTVAAIKTYSAPPKMTIDQNKDYTATIKTNYGDIVVQLFPKNAPLTVNNFVFLARDGFYNGVKFHRVVKDFMIQSGDPKGTGAGGPGYTFADELPTTLDYTKGTIAMANSGTNTNGSQFFIMLADYSNRLPKNYSIFGKVISGQDVVDKIGNVPVTMRNGENSSPTVDVHIDTVIITEN